MPGTVTGIKDTAGHKTNKNPRLYEINMGNSILLDNGNIE